MDYEVIIVGAGPAGIFTALSLSRFGIEPVLLLEQGKDLAHREHDNPEDRLCGRCRCLQRREIDPFHRGGRGFEGIHGRKGAPEAP